MGEPLRCDTCGQPIIFVVVMNNQGRKPARMPLNAHPDPAGNVAVRTDATRTRIGRVLGKGQHAAGGETLYTPHFATCTNPRAHRRHQRKNEARSKAGQPARRPTPTLFTPEGRP